MNAPLKNLSAVKLALMAQQVRAQSEPVLRADPVAIVGMACRLPGGADSPEAFWTLLQEGRDATCEVPADRWDADATHSTDPSAPGKSLTRRGGFLQERIDGFDAAYFGILPREAERMDPQQRLLLEVAIEAFDDAGQPQEHLRGSRTGVYIASYHNDYAQLQYNDLEAVDARTLTGILHSVLANRLSYVLDLRGPSLSIDTACSSSLVAVHLACQGLRHGETDLAIAGGVSLMLTPELMVSLSKVGFMAPDGRCKTFDELADGFGRGEGCAVVVLKRLSDAVADGDRVLAVVRGSAVNSDGHSTLLAAPNGLAQQAMVREALANAQLEPGRIGFVEAHGTGTALGDPIEVEALAATVGRPAPDAGPCYLGAAKANIGHLEAGAGAVGLIKTVLALRHEAIPPQPHFTRLSHHISLAGTRLAVPTALTPWPRGAVPRCAAVSSFGVGGTNAHVIVEEAPLLPAGAGTEAADGPQLLPLSARSPEALRALAARWRDFLHHTPAALSDLVFSAAERRTHHDLRLAVVGRSKQDIASRLDEYLRGEPSPALAEGVRLATALPRVAFVFSGQGPQWFAMGRELLDSEAVFREVLTHIDALLRPLSGWSLLDALRADEATSRLNETEFAQPALFALQVGLAALWKSWGVEPDGLVGHSIGDIAALHLAGVLDLPEAVRVVWHRGRIMQRATGLGRMASVGLDEAGANDLVRPFGERLSVAALNGPRSVVLSGEAAALDEALATLTARGVAHRMLPVQYAFHSAQMAPFQQRLDLELADLRCAAPQRRVFSTVTGDRLDGAPPAGYFGRNVRQPVRFAPAIGAMADEGFDVFLEIGPHPVLAAPMAECLAGREHPPRLLASLRRGKPERESLLQACAGLYAAGLNPAWDALQPEPGQVLPLPAYPWQRKRFWIRQRPQTPAGLPGTPQPHPLLGRRLPLAGDRITVFEGDAAAAQSWLADHRILGRLLLPAAAVMEAFAAAARAVLQSTGVRLEAFTLLRPLALAEAGEPVTRWQFTVTRSLAGALDLELHLALPDGSWQPVASACAKPAPADHSDPASPLLATRVVEATAIYRRFAELGVPFGPAFRTLEPSQAGDGVAEAWLNLPDALTIDGLSLHPVLLDGALQLCSVAAAGASDGLPQRLLLPLGADQLQLLPTAARRLRARAEVEPGEGGRSLVARVSMHEPGGALVARLDGLRFAPADARALQAGTAGARLLVDPVWVPAPAADARAQALDDGTWLLLADRGGVGDALAQALNAAGARCVRLGSDEAPDADLLSRTWRGVVHLRGLDLAALDAVPAADAAAQDAMALGSALALAQGLAGQAVPLWLVGRGAEVVTGQESAGQLRPRAAGLAGLASVIAVEHPECRVRVIDLDPATQEPAAADAQRLLQELRLAAGAPARVALRGAQRWTPQLVRHAGPLTGPRRWVVAQAGALDGARLVPVARAEPGPGEVRLRVLAAGINFRDVLLTLGVYDAPGVPLGAECAGEVVALGAGVGSLAVGDLVFGFAPGSLGTEVVVPAAFLAQVPPQLSIEQAAALPVAFLTAHHGLHGLARLQAGQSVLVHAGAGGVGLAAVQLALRAGARVFATAGSPDKRARLLAMGVAQVMDSRSLDFVAQLREATAGRGVQVVLNSLAGDFIPASMSVLAPGGVFLELGKRDILSTESAAALRPDARYHAYDLGSLALADHGLLRPMFDDLLVALGDGSLRPLPVAVHALDAAVEAFRCMAQARHIGKLVLSVAPVASPRPGASYWVTGGLGGLGLATAGWLVARGARHLALSGRRPPDDAALAAIGAWRAQGVQVQVYAADAGDPAAMAEVLQAIGRDLPPLRGVVHAAGALDDGVLAGQTWSRCQAVLRGKAHGAWVLHELTRDLGLDLFVLYSAAGLWLGAAGQGAYPAANAQLDALAQARRRLALPALSVAWGAWAEVGMAARQAREGRDIWSARGLGQIGPEAGFSALEQALSDGCTHTLALSIDWPRFLARLPAGMDAGVFRALAGDGAPRVGEAGPAQAGSASAGAAGPAIVEQLTALPAGRRKAALVNWLRERCLQVLGLEADTPLDERQALKDAGLDSLMAVELRNALARLLARPLPATLLFDYPTLDALAAHLVRLLDLDTAADAGLQAQATAPADSARRSADDLAALSDEEAEALLLKELEGGSPEHP